MIALAAHEALTSNIALTELLDPMHLLTQTWLKHAVLPAILVIVFIETGLLFPVLPGDSLLFTGGLLAAHPAPPVSIWVLLPATVLTAFLGDQSGYWIGRAIGPALFHKQDSRWFKQRYISETHAFFEKHGPKTIVLGRFVPVVRTFMPVLAGVSRMDYRKFVTFDIVGAVGWGGGVTILGYFLGNVGFVRDHVEAIFLLIVFLSILPGLNTVARRLLAGRRETPLEPRTDTPSPKRADRGPDTLVSTAVLPELDKPQPDSATYQSNETRF